VSICQTPYACPVHLLTCLSVETRTYTGESTSWRPVGPDAWTPVVATATYTVPTTIETVVRPSLITVGQIHGRDIVTVTVDHEEPTETIYEYSSEKRLAPREDQSQELDDGDLDDGDLDDGDLNDSEPDCEGDDCPEPSTDLDPRNKGKWKGPRKGVWMKHPWSMSIMLHQEQDEHPEVRVPRWTEESRLLWPNAGAGDSDHRNDFPYRDRHGHARCTLGQYPEAFMAQACLFPSPLVPRDDYVRRC
jgi:hypothetical protein